jgi:hypothetical protein
LPHWAEGGFDPSSLEPEGHMPPVDDRDSDDLGAASFEIADDAKRQALRRR